MALSPDEKFIYVNPDTTTGEYNLAQHFPVKYIRGLECVTASSFFIYFRGPKDAISTKVTVSITSGFIKEFFTQFVDEVNFGEKAVITLADRNIAVDATTGGTDFQHVNASVGAVILSDSLLSGYEDVQVSEDLDVGGTITGDLTGDVTGNADTATALATPRAINGVDFDGTAAITVTAAGSTLSDTVTVGKGGTGLATVASNTILTGNGTSALTSEANLKFSGDRITIGADDEITPMIRFQNDENTVNVGISKTSNNLLSGDVDGDFVINSTGDHNILFGQNNTIAFTVDTNGDSNLNRRFTVTGDTDGTYEGDVVYFGGTTSMTVGTIYHYKSDGTWEVANANAVATSDGLLGVALGAASDTNGMLLRGMVTLDHDPGAVGDVLFLSNTNGDASATAPSDNNDIVRVIGYCLHASNGQIWFNPDSTFVEVTA